MQYGICAKKSVNARWFHNRNLELAVCLSSRVFFLMLESAISWKCESGDINCPHHGLRLCFCTNTATGKAVELVTCDWDIIWDV